MPSDTNDQIVEELREIKKLLTPAPAAPPPPPPKGMKNEFIDFLSKYKVMGLAVAFILGLYLGAVVQALVKDLIMPVIGLALPGLGNLSTITSSVGKQIFQWGDFAIAVITFIIVAFVIFLIVKITNKVGIQ